MTDKPPFSEQTVVYLGRATLSSGKLAGRWILLSRLQDCLDADDALDKSSLFEYKARALPRDIGGIYLINGRVEGQDLKTVSTAAKHTLKQYENLEWVAVFEARSKADEVAARARKLEQELIADKQLPRVMRSLRTRYGQTDAIGRLALEVVVLNELRKGFS